MSTITLKLAGMHCAHCVHAVEEIITKAGGIKTESVSIGLAEFSTTENWMGLELLKTELDREGFRILDVASLENEV